MPKPKWMNAADWRKCEEYAQKYGTVPELLAAIGWHETHWGRLGWGKKGFHLGVGCYSETNVNYAFQGLDKQLDWAARRLGAFLGKKVNLYSLTNFAKKVWVPGDPYAWAESVYKIYKDLGGEVDEGGGIPFLGTEVENPWFPEREVKAMGMLLEGFVERLKSWQPRLERVAKFLRR